MTKLLLIGLVVNALLAFTAFEYIGRVYDCIYSLQDQINVLGKVKR